VTRGTARRPGPVARLFGSLASALLDLGLPTINGWLKERVGPEADVRSITTDGALIHLEGVRIPIGPRGLVLLDRASATMTPLGRGGLTDIRLCAFTGLVVFGNLETGPFFRAEIAFAASNEPDPSVVVPWIWGELRIRRAAWSARAGSPETNPMSGRARLFVSSLRWRLDQGNLDGEIVRARFTGAGIFEGDDEDDEDERPPSTTLVPPVLSRLGLELDHAKVGPFVDAASALVGQTIAIPSLIPLDAKLDGSLSWDAARGARADLRIAAPAYLEAALGGGFAPDGGALSAKATARVGLAALLRNVGAPREALPRDDDSVRVELEARGTVSRPEVRGGIVAEEIGFRFGRPRFVPPVRVQDLDARIQLVDHQLSVRATIAARKRPIHVVADADLRAGAATTLGGNVKSDGLDASFVRDVLLTLGSKVALPPEIVGAIDLTLDPGGVLRGSIGVATDRSRLTLARAPDGDLSLGGTLDVADALQTGLLAGSVRPAEGAIELALAIALTETGPVARGTATAKRLTVAIATRPDIPPYVLENVETNLVIDRSTIAYDQLAFTGHGARFVARGAIALEAGGRASAPPLTLQLEDGGSALALALLPLARVELPLGPGLGGRGKLVLEASGALAVDLVLDTPAGSALSVEVRLDAGRLDGSTVRGAAAFADLIALGALGSAPPVLGSGVMTVDLAFAGGVLAGWCSATRVALDLGKAGTRGDPPVLTDLTTKLRIDERTIAWKDLEGKAYGGSVVSSGIADRSGSPLRVEVALRKVAVERIPPIDGQEPASLVRGELSAWLVARVAGSFRAHGDARLEEAAFPVLDLARDPLARYGLRPPTEDATAPVTATLAASDWGFLVRDLTIELHGARLRANVGVSRDERVEGEGEIILEEEYLRTSRLLTLPRVLADRLVVPLSIEGPLAKPRVEADLKATLGRFLRDNRVRALVTSAVEEAQILLGRRRRVHEQAASPEDDDGAARELARELGALLQVHDADWRVIEERQRSR
jgi:hypothetical protein